MGSAGTLNNRPSLAEILPCRSDCFPHPPPTPILPSPSPPPTSATLPAHVGSARERWVSHSWLTRFSLRFGNAEIERAFTAHLAPVVAWRTLVGALLVALVHFAAIAWTFDSVGNSVGDSFARSYHIFMCLLCGFEVVMVVAGFFLLYQVPLLTKPQQIKSQAQAQRTEQPPSPQQLQQLPIQHQQQQKQHQHQHQLQQQQQQQLQQQLQQQKPRQKHPHLQPWLQMRMHWELISCLWICFLALTSICCNPWHVATLAGEAPEEVWGHTADRFRELEAFGIFLQGSICMMYSIYVPVRSTYAIIPPITCAVSFILLLVIAGSPFPDSIPGKICLHIFLVFSPLPSVWDRERLSRERWLATGQMLEQDGELTGMRTMSGILCDVFFKLTPALTFCGQDGRRDSWFGTSMEGKPFLDCLPLIERERFTTFIRWVSKSKTTNALHLTLLRSNGQCEVSVSLFAVQLHLPGDGEAQYLVSLKKNEQFDDQPSFAQVKPTNPTINTGLSESSSFELPASPVSLPGVVVDPSVWAALNVQPPTGPSTTHQASTSSQECLSQGTCSEAGDAARSVHAEEGARNHLESVQTDLSFALSESTAPASMSWVSRTGSPLPSSSLRRRSRGLGGVACNDASTQTTTLETAEVGTLTDSGSRAPTPTPSSRPPQIPSDISTMSRSRMMNNTSSRCEPSFCWYNGHDFDGEWVACEDDEVQHVSDWLYCLSIDGNSVLLGDGVLEHILSTEDGTCFLCEGELVLDLEEDRLIRFGKSGHPVRFVRSSSLFERGQREQQPTPQHQHQQNE